MTNMENQNVENSRSVFLEQFDQFIRKQMFPEALALAQERLLKRPLDAEAYVATGRALIAMDRQEEAHRMLRELECNIAALTAVFARLGNLYADKGYEQDARYCYRKSAAFNSSSESSVSAVREKAIFQDMQNMDRYADRHDQSPVSKHLLNTLSGWLVNIQRIKTHAASHQ